MPNYLAVFGQQLDSFYSTGLILHIHEDAFAGDCLFLHVHHYLMTCDPVDGHILVVPANLIGDLGQVYDLNFKKLSTYLLKQ